MLKDKLERCGFCGRWFRGLKIVELEEVKTIPEEELNSAPMGYCPDAQEEQ